MPKLVYTPLAWDDFSDLPRDAQEKIRSAIENRLAKRPELFGRKLNGILKDYWKLRVGDYRIGFKPEKNIIYIVGVGNRKDFYRIMEQRLR